jgi:hypothetical protein
LKKHLEWNQLAAVHLLVSRVEISSLIIDLAAIEEGLQALARLRDILGGFVTAIAHSVEYALWHGSPGFLRKGKPTIEKEDRGLLPVIGELMAAANGAQSLHLYVDTGQQTITATVRPNRLNRLRDGQKEVFSGETAEQWMRPLDIVSEGNEITDDLKGPAAVVGPGGEFTKLAFRRYSMRHPTSFRFVGDDHPMNWGFDDNTPLLRHTESLWDLWKSLNKIPIAEKVGSYWVVVDDSSRPLGYITYATLDRLYSGALCGTHNEDDNAFLMSIASHFGEGDL